MIVVVAGVDTVTHIAVGYIKMLTGVSRFGYSQHLWGITVTGSAGHTGNIHCTVAMCDSVKTGVGVAG